MLMSRRMPPPWRETIRLALWPRRSWLRSIRYARLRLQRLGAMPRSLALGMAAGIFVAVLPIPGLQFLAAAGLAWLIRGHKGAAALATFAANPVTYPLIWIASYGLGAFILGTPASNAVHDLEAISDLLAQPWSPTLVQPTPDRIKLTSLLPAFITMAVGSLPLAIVSALATYAAVRHLLRHHQRAPIGPLHSSVIAPVLPMQARARDKRPARGAISRVAA